ncbi:Gfo/Idh/MocA family protein [Paenibacillus gansuensis]|uniref:Gfo/Idh/MocA family protein n=1 Tax=Paenibacillus gansuensis TaxID=306542 RepID=A0ABW5P9P2_9BACL
MTLRIGMAGTGWFANVHAQLLNAMDGVQVTAVCGTSRDKADLFAAKLGGAAGYADFTEMLDGETLDAVYICVPPSSHGTMEEQLIERGIPFLVEKPLDAGIEKPRRIAAMLEEKPLITSVGYHLRYRDTANRLREALKLGTVGMLSGEWMGNFVNNAWWPKQERSGGQFVEQTTHIVDLLRYTAGEVAEVYAAYAQRHVHTKYDQVSVDDVGTVVLKLRSGAVASLSNTCLLPDGVFEAGLKAYTPDGLWNWSMEELRHTATGQLTTIVKDQGNPYEAENAAFIQAVRTGDASLIRSDYSDALKTQEVTVAALESARSGKPVLLQGETAGAVL